MSDPNPNDFKFNADLDSLFLKELFEGDMQYAEVVFGEFLKDLPDYWKDVESAYLKQEITTLGSAVHKCKTLFGYVGATAILEYFQQFENKCRALVPVSELKSDYEMMTQKKETARLLIETEYKRLQKFHQ